MQQIEQIFHQLSEVWSPPPDYKINEWADAYRQLSPESSAEAGKWRTDRVPFQKEIMEVITDPAVEEVVFVKSSQVGATEILLNTIGYYLDQEPATIMCLQPTGNMARTFSKDRLAPMIRDTARLKDKVKEAKARDSDNTVLHKKTTSGAQITITGSNSPSELASRPVRIILADEVDRYPQSSGSEGDPLLLARARTKTFWNRKIIMTSTPTIKGISRIDLAYAKSDRRVYMCPCPECKQPQELKWKLMSWPENKPELASLSCGNCGSIIPESKKMWMLKNGFWEAQNPGAKTVGFHISELYSPFRSWTEMVADFLVAKESPELLKTFVNTSLGETYEEQGDELEADSLMHLCENYNHEAVPDDVLVLTCGVDTQKDRLECQTVGYSKNETWVIEYKVIFGNPSTVEVWQELDEYLSTTFSTESGRKLPIKATAIDSGGHHANMVYAYTRERFARGIFAVKGSSVAGKPIAERPRAVGRLKAMLSIVGTDTAKEYIHARLRSEKKLIHFPNTVDLEYFKQLTAEKLVRRMRMGVERLVWINPGKRRNEALDTMVYSLAALHVLQPNFDKIEEQLHKQKNKPKPKKDTLIAARRRLYRKNPRNFVSSWKD